MKAINRARRAGKIPTPKPAHLQAVRNPTVRITVCRDCGHKMYSYGSPRLEDIKNTAGEVVETVTFFEFPDRPVCTRCVKAKARRVAEREKEIREHLARTEAEVAE